MNRADFDRTLTLPSARPDAITAADFARGPLGTALYLAAHPNPPHDPLTWIRAAINPTVYAGDKANLLAGAPALAFTLACATGGRVPDHLHKAVLTGIRAHLDAADKRIATGRVADFADYDLFSGLTGLGAYLLHTDSAATELTQILDHLARIADPARCNCDGLPLWWVAHAPNSTGIADDDFTHGHGNFGAAHGLAGLLAFLALTAIEGIAAPRHIDAIWHLFDLFDHWQQSAAAPWWPQWITRDELDVDASTQTGPGRPSWCYGTPGVVRAQQLAGIALGDRGRSITAATALRTCLTDSAQLARITDSSLCHGWAGIYQTAWRVHEDEPDIIDLPLLDRLADQIQLDGDGLLEGRPGQALAAFNGESDTNPTWDLLLLLA